MALITCPKCGKQFSEHANACPQCGIPTDDAVRMIREREEFSKSAHQKNKTEGPYQVSTSKKWWHKFKWYVIGAGITVCVILPTIFLLINNTSHQNSNPQESTVISADVADDAGDGQIFYPLKEHDEAWRQEQGFLLGQIRDDDGCSNVREEKNGFSDVVAQVKDGEAVLYKNDNSNWRPLYDLDGRFIGYIYKSLIIPLSVSPQPRRVEVEYKIETLLGQELEILDAKALKEISVYRPKDIDVGLMDGKIGSHNITAFMEWCPNGRGFLYYNSCPKKLFWLKVSYTDSEEWSYDSRQFTIQVYSDKGKNIGEIKGTVEGAVIEPPVEEWNFTGTYTDKITGKKSHIELYWGELV